MMRTGAAMQIRIPKVSIYPWKMIKDVDVISTEKATMIRVTIKTIVFTLNRVNSLVRGRDWERLLFLMGHEMVIVEWITCVVRNTFLGSTLKKCFIFFTLYHTFRNKRVV